MKVLVTGGRNFKDEKLLFSVLDEKHELCEFETLIHGNCRGADTLAGKWAEMNQVTVKKFPADWKKHGLSAGPMRNKQMIKEKPDLVIAFSGGNGTANMINVAKKAGIRVIEV